MGTHWCHSNASVCSEIHIVMPQCALKFISNTPVPTKINLKLTDMPEICLKCLSTQWNSSQIPRSPVKPISNAWIPSEIYLKCLSTHWTLRGLSTRCNLSQMLGYPLKSIWNASAHTTVHIPCLCTHWSHSQMPQYSPKFISSAQMTLKSISSSTVCSKIHLKLISTQ